MDIKSIIATANIGKPQQTIRRINYKPYDMGISGNVWNQIGTYICGNYKPKLEALELIKYAHNDGVYDSKGLLLKGQPGTGKTTAMRILNEYMKIDDVRYLDVKNKPLSMQFKIIPSRQAVAEYQAGGNEAIEYLLSYHNLCIDDIGSEQTTANYFGTKCDVMNEIIERRYISGKLTHATTNLGYNEIAQKYGERIASRLVDMCHIVVFTGNDLRI
jgi:DNA replication protein DnaC